MNRIFLLATSLSLTLAWPAAGLAPTFKIYVEHPGPYRVSFEDLVELGLPADGLPSAGIGLSREGHAVPVWVEDGDDGIFDRGDWIEMLGEPPRGWISYFDEHTRYNVYFLRFDDVAPFRMKALQPVPAADTASGFHDLRSERHFEQDELILRLAPTPGGRPNEIWFWAKLTHQDDEPFVHDLQIDDVASDGTVELRLEFRGWSQIEDKPDPQMPDHRVEVLYGGKVLGAGEWNGREPFLLTIPDIPAQRFAEDDTELSVRIPTRETANGPLIDVVMLNWIEVTYPRVTWVGGDRWSSFELTAPDAAKPLRLRSGRDDEFLLYGREGSRITSDSLPETAAGEFLDRIFEVPTGETSFVVAGTRALESPAAIVRDQPTRWRDAANRADYLMITHRRLMRAIRPLAAFHRSRGLDVEVVDIQDVYDEFSHGVARPQAVRDFLAHTYHQWTPPAPRFVLLVGDASWLGRQVDINDGSFPDHVPVSPSLRRPPPTEVVEDPPENPDDGSTELDIPGLKLYTPYDDETDLANRQLVPTWNHATVFGHSASDNHFVAVDGDDELPDMAIGRLPVVDPDAVRRIVDKTIRYISDPQLGPWRRNAAFLTNTMNKYHRQSQKVADFLNASGFSAGEIYPEIDEPDNQQYTDELIDSLNEGQLFVHYLGHGGRFIWETGRRDLSRNRDLFTLEHLDGLDPAPQLPVVLSLTCFGAPFDHPEADSLGERFLRVEDRGAIAVVAASWTNGPTGLWGQVLLEELTATGTTIGEALQRAKHRLRDPMFVNVYNLLGDPAVPVALPSHRMRVETSGGGDGTPLTVHGVLDGVSSFSGELLIELIDDERTIMRSVTTRLDGYQFHHDVDVSAEELEGLRVVRAYAWDTGRGLDAAGAVDFAGPPKPLPSELFRAPFDARQRAGAAPAAAGGPEIRTDTVAWWSFDEAVGRQVLDRQESHPGWIVERAQRAEGPTGGGLSLQGRGFVDVAADRGLDLGTDDFSIQAWIATRQSQREAWVILDKRSYVGYHLYTYWGQLGLQISDGSFTNYTGPFIADGTWHHVVVTVDRDQVDGVRWYIDGVEAGTRGNPTEHQGSLDNPSPLFLGGRPHGGGHFSGGLDEVAVFKRALNAAEVEQLFRYGWDWLSPPSGD